MQHPIASNRAQRLVTVAGLSAIALLFVPFAYDYIPIRNAFRPDFLDPTWQEVWPCLLLPWLITAGYVARLRLGKLPRTAAVAFLSIAGLAVLPFAYFLVSMEWPLGWRSLPILLCFAVPIASVAAFVALAMTGTGDLRGLAAMQGIYVSQLCFWLLLAFGDLHTGAWLGMLAVASYLTQMSLFAKRRVWATAFVAGMLVPPIALYLVQW